MSIQLGLGQADSSSGLLQLAAALGCLGISLSIAAAAGVFHRGSVVGPPRLQGRDRLASVWMTLMIGFGCWIIAQQMYVSFRAVPAEHSTTKPATQVSLSPWDTVILSSAGEFTLLATLAGASFVLHPHGLRRLGLSVGALPAAIIPALVGVAAVIPLIYAAMVGTQELWDVVGMKHPNAHPLLQQLRDHSGSLLPAMVAISAVLIAPPAEELLFRGHLQTVISHALALGMRRQHQGRGFDVVQPERPTVLNYETPPFSHSGPPPAARWGAIFITSIAFAAVHPGLWMMPPIFLLSVCIGYAYERTANLWVAIFLHAAFNAFNLLTFWSQLSSH